MHQGKLVFAQVMAHLPLSTFRRCVTRYHGEHKVKRFSCLDQFYAMAFAQLTFRESLRGIEACLATQGLRLYHMGFRAPVARNILANANAVRPWQIYADLAQHLIGIARPLYAAEPIGLDFKWIKQHLRIKAFFGTSENAVKTQIWIAVATYVLIAIVKKRAMLPHSLYELLQILSLTMFETTPINQLLAPSLLPQDDDQQLVLLCKTLAHY